MSTEPTFTGSVDDECPPGFHRLRRQRQVPADAVDRARATVLSWRFLQDAGLRVEATTARPELGSVVRQHLGPVIAPCRIVELFDDDGRAGFSYASLPGHPEQGVERFGVERRADGTVWAVVESISRGASWYARMGGPITRRVQAWMVGRYLAAIIGRDVSRSRKTW